MTAALEALRAALAKPLPDGEVFMAHGVVMLDKGGGELDALDRNDYVMACLNAAPELLAEVDRLKAEREALRTAIQQALPFTLLIGQETLQRALKEQA